MMYMEKESGREVILLRYYNVLFYIVFKAGVDEYKKNIFIDRINSCLLYTSPSPRDVEESRMPSSA